MKEKIKDGNRAAAPGPGILSKTNSQKQMTSNNKTIKESSTSILSKTPGKVNNKEEY